MTAGLSSPPEVINVADEVTLVGSSSPASSSLRLPMVGRAARQRLVYDIPDYEA